MMNKLAGVMAILFGAVSITGGAVGAHVISIPGLPHEAGEGSMASLYAGGGAGIVLVVCGIGLFLGFRLGACVALFVSLGLLGGRFIPSFFKNREDLAGFLEKTSGKVSAAMVFCGVLMIVLSGLALMQPKKEI